MTDPLLPPPAPSATVGAASRRSSIPFASTTMSRKMAIGVTAAALLFGGAAGSAGSQTQLNEATTLSASLEEKVDALTASLSERDAQVAALEDDVAALEKDAATEKTAATALKTARDRAKELESDLKTAQADLTTAQADLTTARADLATAQTDLAASVARVPELESASNKTAPQSFANTPPASTTTSYANCTEARAAGVTPLYRGDPGYSSKLDRDGDGVACE